MGGETKNIDEMAQLISDKIFTELKWKWNSEYTDINWDCCDRAHARKTHPTDLVFSYVDPYTELTQYIQTDLKSYKKESISTQKVGTAIKSLAMQVKCARDSTEWADYYREGETKYGLHGMLFIYNNDDRYDDDLLEKIDSNAMRDFALPRDSTLNIYSPRLIRFLMTVVENIKERRNIEEDESGSNVWKMIPKRNKCGFYYPDKHNKCSSDSVKHPATNEMVTSGMLLYSYEHPIHKKKVLNIYWDEDIISDNYFIYLFEYIFNYQMLNMFEKVYIITPFSGKAPVYFNTAQRLYRAQYAVTETQRDKLERIELIGMDTIKTSLFPLPIILEGAWRNLVKGTANA
ncbi:hypothetical protein [Photobacterium iliopiscarium]|uniref:hypothetical protein n=1 Tax=Photobacterium iliopiscarium TaxID=56192 RepID=UPI0005D390AA|nr:hypothetical protein [Photobacterium iliopiscarium]KJG12892.1 hypothetical protein UB38_12525 [Photobacterium iliopiscarium]PST97648.1 hypothetical protein C9I85_17840 [Photobacterium iliopiscarium]PSV81539.1 hypothetical protein C9J51_14070 [Photobacterium iliopiscarium]